MMRLLCADQEDMPKTSREVKLDKIKEKYVPTPPWWCGDVCKVKMSTNCKKSWTEDCMRRQHLFKESLAREEEREHREKEKKERKKREEERVRNEKEARQEERARKLARSCDAQAEDEARDKKGIWRRTTQ
ncbi:hypothetical protein D1007_23759 [Hordeum vulgare]|nr:hypothetical protein D1007_23759 [Hordeum vulgare]